MNIPSSVCGLPPANSANNCMLRDFTEWLYTNHGKYAPAEIRFRDCGVLERKADGGISGLYYPFGRRADVAARRPVGQVMITLAHEWRHAYQHAVYNGLDEADAERWAESTVALFQETQCGCGVCGAWYSEYHDGLKTIVHYANLSGGRRGLVWQWPSVCYWRVEKDDKCDIGDTFTASGTTDSIGECKREAEAFADEWAHGAAHLQRGVSES